LWRERIRDGEEREEVIQKGVSGEEEWMRRRVGSGIGNADYGGHSISPLLTPNKQWHYWVGRLYRQHPAASTSSSLRLAPSLLWDHFRFFFSLSRFFLVYLVPHKWFGEKTLRE
jgi:hypothetical protein